MRCSTILLYIQLKQKRIIQITENHIKSDLWTYSWHTNFKQSNAEIQLRYNEKIFKIRFQEIESQKEKYFGKKSEKKFQNWSQKKEQS